MVRGWVGRCAVIGLFILSHTFSIDAWPGTSALGTARGRGITAVRLMAQWDR